MNRKERRAAAKIARQDKSGLASAKALQLAIGLQRDGRLAQAEKTYRRILKASPSNADALHYLGILRHQQNRSEEALELIRKSISLNPGNPDAHNNLGNVLMEYGREEEAATAYRECLRINPDNADALSNLGVILKHQGEYEDALDFLQLAVSVAPEHADAHHNLGNTFRELKRIEEAIAAYLQSISIRPHDPAGYKSLCTLLYKEGRITEVTDVYREWLNRDPNNPVARHMVAACSGQEVPLRASDSFVTQTFDSFAAEFDKTLGRQEYSGPELVAKAVAGEFGKPESTLQVFDAGCGTGLCGPVLRPFCRRLVGVDLSGMMIEKAAKRGTYNELVVGELTEFMETHANCYDLIVSADTLIYFGALERVLAAACSALVPGGRMMFTLEENVDGKPGEDFRLNPHGRYTHTRNYVAQTLDQCALELRAIEVCTLRKEGDKPVRGLFVTALKG